MSALAVGSVAATLTPTGGVAAGVAALQAELLPAWLASALARRVGISVVGLVLIWTAARLIRRYLSRWIQDPGSRYVARKAVNVVAAVAAMLFVAAVLLEGISGLGVALGVAGAGLAFALQEAILSVAGWLAISFGGYYRTGDRVRVGDVTGDVIDVSVLRTTLFEVGEWIRGDMYNGRVARVANAAVLRKPVYNYSGDFPFLWDEIHVPIRHGSDRAKAREILERAVRETVGDYVPRAQATWRTLMRKYLLAEGDVEPKVHLTADENWLTYTVRYVAEYRGRRAEKDELWRRVLDGIEEAGADVRLAVAAQEITVTDDSEIGVRRGGGDRREDDGYG